MKKDPDLPVDPQDLLRSYIRRGSAKTFSLDELTGEIKPDTHNLGTIPSELLAVLLQMQNGDPNISPEMLQMFDKYKNAVRHREAKLTPEQKQQLRSFYNKLQEEGPKPNPNDLDASVQNALEEQKRLRQSLATQVFNALKDQNQDQDDDGDGDEDGDPYQDESEDSEDGSGEGASEDNNQQDAEGDSSGDDGSDGHPDDSKGPRPEDSKKGLDEWLKDLEKQAEEQQKEDADAKDAEAEASAEEGQGDDDGKDGNEAQKGDIGGPQGNPVYELSPTDQVDPKHVRIVKQAFDKLLAKGRNNPTTLPRWDKRDFVKRMLTMRPLKPAKKPTLERHAVMFVIDNSGSMGGLEAPARAFAAALSRTSGPGGADVVVVTSFNGNYTNSDVTRSPQAECWFLNGKYKGFLPDPPPGSGVDKKHHTQCWAWFIRKALPRYNVRVKTIGIYGDNNGGHIWCYLSNALKETPFLWFNPSNQKGVMQEGPVIVEENPFIADRNGLVNTQGHQPGDLRYEKFRGLSFLHVTSADDIVNTLRRHVRN